MCLVLVVLLIVFLCLGTKGDGSTDEGARVRCRQSERRALVSFKEGFMNHEDCLSSWNTTDDADCCKWEGVGCNNVTGHVVTIDLRATDPSFVLQGQLSSALLGLPYLSHLDVSLNNFQQNQIPEFLGSLAHLEYLNLSNANFRGTIPGHLGNLSFLKYLDLSGNGHSLIRAENLSWISRLSSLEVLNLSKVDLKDAVDWMEGIRMVLPSMLELKLSFCRLENPPQALVVSRNTSLKLKVLDLSVNHLNGTIPNWLMEMGHGLVYLNLSINKLDGYIPDAIFEGMASLAVLDLSNNSFYGHLPKALALREHPSLRQLILFGNRLNGSLVEYLPMLSKLEVLDVAVNQLEGVVTDDHLLNFSSLRVLDFSHNKLAINVSPSWVPRFQLEALGLGSCQLGPLFPIWMRTQKNLSSISLPETGITGTVPGWFWNFSLQVETMVLSLNLLQGNVPDLTSLPQLSILDLSYNLFSGQLPQFPPTLLVAVLASNSFSGPMFSFCDNTSSHNRLAYLDLSNNSLSGPIPDCFNCVQDLAFLILLGNNFSGKIPDTIGHLSQLCVLALSGNSLSGEIPSSLRNCINLNILDLGENRFSGHIPVWLDNKFFNLVIIILVSNVLEGNIPLQLCQLTWFILDLSGNRLSGEIPWCLNKVDATSTPPYVVYLYFHVVTSIPYVRFTLDIYYDWPPSRGLDLSSNKLSGEFPLQITNLIGLFYLNLSRNNLTGAIPPGLGGMKSLEALDLSWNQFSCAIPASISNLTSLLHLNLSHNKLSGPIPQQNQLHTFDNSSFLANQNLCGSPLTTECSEQQTYEDPSCINVQSQIEKQENAAETEDNGLNVALFYVGAGLGFLAGFWGFWATLLFHKTWRHSYFRSVETAFDNIYISVAVAAKRLQRKLSDQANT